MPDVSERAYTVTIENKIVKVASRKLAAFRDMYFETSELTAQMSELLWLDIFILDYAFGVNPHEIINAIRDLEQGEPPTGVKLASQFKNMPLKGLWHKHYFSAHFLVQNILSGLGKTGLEKLAKEVIDPAKSSVFNQDMLDELARRITHEQVEARESAKKLTGEWIIYLRHGEKTTISAAIPSMPVISSFTTELWKTACETSQIF